MDVQSIGESAGVIWRLLEGEHRKWDYNEIKKATVLHDRQFNSSIVLLSRDCKLCIYDTTIGKKRVLYIELNYYIG